MITIKSTVTIIHIEEGINQPCSGDYHYTKDKKWLDFCKKYNLTHWDATPWGKWYELYLMLCAEGLL